MILNRFVAILALIAVAPLIRAHPRPPKPETCHAYADLLSSGHLSIRIKLDLIDPADQAVALSAFKYWSTILDVDYVVDNASNSQKREKHPHLYNTRTG